MRRRRMNVSMIKEVVKIGKELGLEFTDEELKELGLKKGDHLEWFERNGKLMLEKVKD